MMTAILILIALCALPATLLLVGWASRPSAGDDGSPRRKLWRAIVTHAVAFGTVYFGVLFWAADTAFGNEPEPANTASANDQVAVAEKGLSVGEGLGMLGVALATGLSVLGAGYAVAVIGAAALGTIAEKPELFGRTLVFIGLAEGLAIYGLIVSILILGRL